MIIVLARADKTALVATGHHTRFDGVNYRPDWRLDWEARSAIWLNKGTRADAAKAAEYAAKDGWTVYTYPTTERDPLAKARRDAIKAAKDTS